MNDANRESIIKMIADGTLKPDEGARLLARLSEEEHPNKQNSRTDKGASGSSNANLKNSRSSRGEKERTDKQAEEAEKPVMEKVAIKGADGKEKVIEVPPGLVPMITRIVAEQIKEHSIKVARETATGAKNLVLNKFDELRDTLKTAVSGGKKPETGPATPVKAPEELKRADARRRILGMVQSGHISAIDAGKLIRELDALEAYGKEQSEPSDSDTEQRSKKRK